MANRYANLVGTNKIKDEWSKINTGFDKVQQEIDAHLADYAQLRNARNGLNANAIINGNFDVWQRGTVFTTPSYTADRWRWSYNGTGQTGSISRAEFARGSNETEVESAYFLSAQVTAAPSNQTYNLLEQAIEGVRTFAGKKVTLSFYARADATRTLGFVVEQHFGNGGSPIVYGPGRNFTLQTYFQKFTFTFDVPSIGGKNIGPNDALRLFFRLPTNTTYRVDIAQVQLCAGEVALPFQPRSFAEELALCQRYFQLRSSNNVPATDLRPSMRTAPTVIGTSAPYQYDAEL